MNEAIKLAIEYIENVPDDRQQVTHIDRDALVAALRAHPTGWQPIETAPKDFVTLFDGWNGERVTDVIWGHPEYSPKGHYDWCISEYTNGFGWANVGVKGLTHWMPLPPAPEGK